MGVWICLKNLSMPWICETLMRETHIMSQHGQNCSRIGKIFISCQNVYIVDSGSSNNSLHNSTTSRSIASPRHPASDPLPPGFVIPKLRPFQVKGGEKKLLMSPIWFSLVLANEYFTTSPMHKRQKREYEGTSSIWTRN